MNPSFSSEYKALCGARLGEITEADCASLTEFAECRLATVGAPPAWGEDVTQRAFQNILIGMETDQGGRKPRLMDLNDKPAFLNYMRGVISSLVYSMTRKRRFHVGNEQWDDNIASGEVRGASPANQVALRDFGEQLFPRLRSRAPRRLLPTIAAWEAVFLESDRIPARGHRKYVREVRDLAQTVLEELGGLG